jgi:Bacterial PH domain
MTDAFISPVERELSAGERLLWKGRPRGGLRLRDSDRFQIPFSLLWGGFAIFWVYSALFAVPARNAAGWTAPIIGIPFVLIGLYMIIGRFFVDAKMREVTEYAVTNRRAIIVSRLFSTKTQSVDLKATPEITLDERADRSGTITFGTVQNYGRRRSVQPSFEMIEDARQVYNIIEQARSR